MNIVKFELVEKKWCAICTDFHEYIILSNENVFHHDIQTQLRFLDNFEAFGYRDKTNFREYDIAFQTNQYFKRKSRRKLD